MNPFRNNHFLLYTFFLWADILDYQACASIIQHNSPIDPAPTCKWSTNITYKAKRNADFVKLWLGIFITSTRVGTICSTTNGTIAGYFSYFALTRQLRNKLKNQFNPNRSGQNWRVGLGCIISFPLLSLLPRRNRLNPRYVDRTQRTLYYKNPEKDIVAQNKESAFLLQEVWPSTIHPSSNVRCIAFFRSLTGLVVSLWLSQQVTSLLL